VLQYIANNNNCYWQQVLGYTMRLIEQIITLKHCCQNREEELRENLGLTVSEYNCLASFPSDRTVSGSELAGHLHISPSRMSRVADALVRRDLINRTQSGSDRRVQHYELTSSGLRLKNDIRKSLEECEAGLIARLSESDLADIEKGMSKLLEAMTLPD